MTIKESNIERDEFIEGRDYYFDCGLMVLTADFLTRRGYCCGNGCRHCPYEGTPLKKKDLDVIGDAC